MDERFKVNDQGPKRRMEMICDILPFVGQIIAPENIRDVTPELFQPHELLAFTMALDLMVLFDIRLLPASAANALETDVARYEPNIGQLIKYGPQKTFVRGKTQALIR